MNNDNTLSDVAVHQFNRMQTQRHLLGRTSSEKHILHHHPHHHKIGEMETLDGNKASVGDHVTVLKQGRQQGKTAVVSELDWAPGRLKVKMGHDGSVKSYMYSEVRVQVEHSQTKLVEPISRTVQLPKANQLPRLDSIENCDTPSQQQQVVCVLK